MLSHCDLSAFMKLVAIVPDLPERIKSAANLERRLQDVVRVDKVGLAGKGESAKLYHHDPFIHTWERNSYE